MSVFSAFVNHGNLNIYPSASGGTITTDGDYRIHTFTTSGTFTLEEVGSVDSYNKVDILMVAGGGGGGTGNGSTTAGGGGGSGALVYISGSNISALTVGLGYSINIGAGGSTGANGVNTTAFDYTVPGGGYGGTYSGGGSTIPNSGGSGGGCFDDFGSGGNGALGIAATTGSLFNANIFYNKAGNGYASSGGGPGGGGGAAGTNAITDYNGSGGPGYTLSISGTPVIYAKGGDGGNGSVPTLYGQGGAGGYGGGPARTGGYQGIVIIRYKYQN